MSRKLALKKLKASDLSFFVPYLNRFPNTKQKGFNLDQRVIEAALFPTLSDEVEATPDKRAPVALTILGPGGAPAYLLMRKVLKQQKNWRLNGEAVANPPGESHRFDGVAPEDIAIMEFSGTSLPSAVKVVLLSATNPMDAATHAAFRDAFPGESMSLLSEERIEQIIHAANTPLNHPIRDWLDKESLEKLGQGDPDATEWLLKTRKGRGVTASELKKAKESAEKVGRRGEQLLDYYFESFAPTNGIRHEWVANVNAISPFDFKLTLGDASERHVDAKSTSGPFGGPVHFSLGEIRHALTSGVPYDIHRLYDVTDNRCVMRVARDIAEKLRPIANIVRSLPDGVSADQFSFRPEFFDFDTEETVIEYADDAD